MRDLVTPQHAWFIVEGRTVLATEPARVRVAVDSVDDQSLLSTLPHPPTCLFTRHWREREAPLASAHFPLTPG